MPLDEPELEISPTEKPVEPKTAEHDSETMYGHKHKPTGLAIAGYYTVDKIKQLIPVEYHQEVKMKREKTKDASKHSFLTLRSTTNPVPGGLHHLCLQGPADREEDP